MIYYNNAILIVIKVILNPHIFKDIVQLLQHHMDFQFYNHLKNSIMEIIFMILIM